MGADHTTPAVAELTLGQKALLLSGRDTWTTQPIEAAGIRSVRLSDGPHGLRFQPGEGDALAFQPSLPATCFPPAVALGSSWDPELVARVGEALGREALAFEVDVVLGPGVNIKRSPLCGRNFEYFSEDPLLSGVLGAAHVEGLQGTGVGASVKHFAANNQETDRMRVSAEVDERTLREIYFPAFERVVKQARPATVMCAYNRINGIHASENQWLLTRVLREEWGFEGVVVSDWGAVQSLDAAVAAGLDLEMPGTNGRGSREVEAAVLAGELDERDVDRSVMRILKLTELGRPGAGTSIDEDAHHRLAREAAAQSIVLLKNDGTLPLRPDARIAVVGEFARSPRFQGGGSSHVVPTRQDAFLESVQARNLTVAFSPGFTVDGSGDAAALRRDAVDAASRADVAVVFAGLAESDESEGYDRTTLDLPAPQVEVIRAVAAAAPRTVVVLSHGGVVSLEGWHDDVDAILDGFLLGQAGGAALADVVFGEVNPSGRLAESIPLRIEDTPAYGNFPGEQGHVVHGERGLVGYRWYATRGIPVRYAFGHGLTYTTFRTSDFTVEATGATTATVRVTVENTGDRDGAHVVQVYVDSTGLGVVHRSARHLAAFRKVAVPAGASVTVELSLDRRAFAYWDVGQQDWVVTPGPYRVVLGNDALTVDQEATIELGGDVVIPELTLRSTVQEWFEHPLVGPVLLDKLGSDLLRQLASTDALRMLGSIPMQKVVNVLGESVASEDVDALMALSRGEKDGAMTDLETGAGSPARPTGAGTDSTPTEQDQYWQRVVEASRALQVAAAEGTSGDRELVARLTKPRPEEQRYEPRPAEVQAVVVPSPPHDVPVRIYRRLEAGPSMPLLVWCHGGAFLGGDLDMPEADAVAREVADRAGAVVVSVDYRLCVNGIHAPAPNDDLTAVFEWAVANAERLGADASRVSIGGASAGACLAAAVAVRLRDAGGPQPGSVVLAYPVVHAVLPEASPELREKLAGLDPAMAFSPEVIEPVMENYLGGPAAEASGHTLAGCAADLTGLPATLIINCEYDGLRASGERFGQQLREAGVEVDVQLAPGVAHGHLNRPGLEEAQRSLAQMSHWVARRHEAGGSE